MIRLLAHLRVYRPAIAAVLVLTVLQTIAQLFLPLLLAELVDNGIIAGDIAYLWRVGGRMLMVAAAGVIAAMLAAFFAARASMGFGMTLRDRVFARVQAFSLNEMGRFGTASLITRTTNDVTQVQMVTMIALQLMILAPITAIGGVVMALGQDRQLTWVLAVAVPVLAVLILFVVARGLPLFRVMQLKLDHLNRVVRERLTGMRVIRAFDRDGFERERFHLANLDLTDVSIRVNRIIAVMMPAMMVVMNLTSVALVWFGAQRIDLGAMQIGNLLAFIQYATQILFALLMLTMLFVMLPRGIASGTRINAVLEVEPSIREASHPQQPAPLQPGQRRGHLRFRNVTFRYEDAEQPAIADLSFEAAPGELVALIGGTGAGKTTVINLLLRFYDPESGTIELDGVDLAALPLAVLREHIGLVPQRANLFTGTIADNIRYGRPQASDEEIDVAADLAQAEFVRELAEGTAAPVAQGGDNLSGGQKQRLAIARALVRKPPIYVLDDSFSALDFRTEARLRVALRARTAEATVLVVAQRVTSIVEADRIVVLDRGKAVGIGTHAELLDSCSVYREIADSQLATRESA